MAIFAYVGLPGAGKSYEVVRGPVSKARASKRPIWTNIPLKFEGATVIEGVDATTHWYLRAPPGSLIVIDECWRYWGAGMTADSIPEEIREWFAMHRHRTADGRSTDIILVCQDLSQVARFMRDLVERTYRANKMSALGFRNRYRVDIYDGAVTGQKPSKAQLVGSWWGKYEKKVYQLYQSHTQGETAKEISPDDRGAAWKSLSVLAIPLALIAVPVIGMNVDFAPADASKVPHKAAPAAPAKPQPAALVPQLQPAEPMRVGGHAPVAEPGDSELWRLAGVIDVNGKRQAIISKTGASRRIPIDRCSEDDAGEWICILDGQRIASWTGQNWTMYAQASTFSGNAPSSP